MATTPGTYARFIGRVGALAVALGIGTAVVNSPGLAAAEDGPSSDTSASASDTTGSGGSTQSSSADGQAGAGDAGLDDDSAADGAGDEDDASDAADEDEDDSPTGESGDDDAGDAGDDDAGDADTGADEDDDDGRASDTPPVEEHDEAEPAGTTPPESRVQRLATTSAPVAAETPAQKSVETGAATSATTTLMRAETIPAPPPQTVTTPVNGFVTSVLSVLGLAPRAVNGPATPPEPPLLWAMLASARRELGTTVAPVTSAASVPTAALVAEADTVSPLATPEQLAAERLAAQTANSLPVVLMKMVLRQQFLAAAYNLYGRDGVDQENLAALDRAVDEYAMAAAFQQQLLDSMNPKVVTQVAPPHVWFGQNVPGSRILYDNPDTIYRFMGVNGASEYVITGRFHDTGDGVPTDVTFSVLEGLAGTTSSLLTYDDLQINEDGTFTITVSREAANGRPNHLQLTNGSTIIAARDTLGDWNAEVPMSLSIARVGGPPNSLFAQIGGFAFLGQFVSGNPLLTSLVSLVPPLPYMPPLLRGVFTAAILVVRGANEQAKYMALATNDPETGAPRPVNTVSQPASNAEFLANQRQSNGHFQLADDEVLVLTIDPGEANYFIVPTYNIWTITDNYWDEPASLNNTQLRENPEDGTYTVVISPTDPGAANWVSTSGLNQGTLSIRFQDLPATVTDPPRIVDQRVMSHAALRDHLPADAFVTAEERAAQLAARKAGFDNRWAPYPQP